MSLNVSKNEYLMHLIYHHLKENGFQNAADELQNHAPQLESRPLSTSLLEIYDKWFSENSETTQEDNEIGLEACESNKSSSGKTPTSAPGKARRQLKDTYGGKKVQSQVKDAMIPPTLKLIVKSPSKLVVAASHRKETQTEVPQKTTTSEASSESTEISSGNQEGRPVSKATSTARGLIKAEKAKPALDKSQVTSTPASVKAKKTTPKAKKTKASRKAKASTEIDVLTVTDTAKAAEKTIIDSGSGEDRQTVALTIHAAATPKEKKRTTKKQVEPATRKTLTSKEKAVKPSAKRKKSPDKPDDAVVNEKKASVPQTESISATDPTPPFRDDGSDSDSSLDVEKWMKLALELSDADMARMDTLESSGPALKKPRVRKPRTKATPKARSHIKHIHITEEKKRAKIEKDAQLKVKGHEAKTAAVDVQAVTIQPEPVAAAEGDSLAAPSTTKEDSNPKATKREKMYVTPAVDQVENVLSEPKRKKRKKDMAAQASETADGIQTEATPEESTEIIKEKRKKLKKDKEAGESVSENLEEQKGNYLDEDVMEERVTEKVNTKENYINAKNMNINTAENKSVLELTTEIEADLHKEQAVKKKKKRKKDKGPKENEEDGDPLPPSAAESQSPPTGKKKKKHKSKQLEDLGAQATGVQNCTPEQIPPDSTTDTPKKKKKSSKSKDLRSSGASQSILSPLG